MYYLQDEDLARQLVELGYRGSGDTLQRWAVDTRYFEVSHPVKDDFPFSVSEKVTVPRHK